MESLETVSGKKILLNVCEKEVNIPAWVEEHREFIETSLCKHGAVLIRGLNIVSSGQFGDILRNFFGENLAKYEFRSTPRTELRNQIYTATEYPKSERIVQHSENAYSHAWPLRLGFFAMVPPSSGGETPLSDTRLILRSLPHEIVEEFVRKKIKYIRNFNQLDLPWQEVFQTSSKEMVERYCRENSILFKWKDGDTLNITHIHDAVRTHPLTKENVWFNQAHIFHISNHDKIVRDGLLTEFGTENLPRHALFGDDSEIDEEILTIIRSTIENNTYQFSWERSDLLLLDNMLHMHGRNSYSGTRKILVGMAKLQHQTI